MNSLLDAALKALTAYKGKIGKSFDQIDQFLVSEANVLYIATETLFYILFGMYLYVATLKLI